MFLTCLCLWSRLPVEACWTIYCIIWNSHEDCGWVPGSSLWCHPWGRLVPAPAPIQLRNMFMQNWLCQVFEKKKSWQLVQINWDKLVKWLGVHIRSSKVVAFVGVLGFCKDLHIGRTVCGLLSALCCTLVERKSSLAFRWSTGQGAKCVTMENFVDHLTGGVVQ